MVKACKLEREKQADNRLANPSLNLYKTMGYSNGKFRCGKYTYGVSLQDKEAGRYVLLIVVHIFGNGVNILSIRRGWSMSEG